MGEIEEPLFYDNLIRINSSNFEDETVNTEHKHLRTPQVMQIHQEQHVVTSQSKKRLINEPMLMQPRLHEHQEKYHDKSEHVVRFVHTPKAMQDENPSSENYYHRSQSEGHNRLIQHIEESLESVNQYIKLSDTSQSSLQNTLQMNLQ